MYNTLDLCSFGFSGDEYRVEKDYLINPNFNPDYIRSKSGAAAGLCGWVVNICKYFRIYQVVAPKRIALGEANKKLENANKKLTGTTSDYEESISVLNSIPQ